VANYGSNTTSVINASTNTVTATVPVGDWPFGVAVTPDGSKVCVVGVNFSVINTSTNIVTDAIDLGFDSSVLGQFIGGPAPVTNSTTATDPDCKEIKDYLPKYTNGVDLNIVNEVGNDILVVWTTADSKNSVFKANVLTGKKRTVTAPTGSFDEYIRVSYPQVGCPWYRVNQNTNDVHTELEPGYEYTVTYYWGSYGNGLTPINDSEAPV
jgi:YVTN family beta-propeller protein